MGSVKTMMGAGLSGAAAVAIGTGTVATGLTAAGTSTANALVLAADVNLVTTAASGTGVRLPDVEVGSQIFVANGGLNALLVYPTSGGQMNGNTADAGLTLGVKKGAIFARVSASQWVGAGDAA